MSQKTPRNKDKEGAVTIPPNKPRQDKLLATLRKSVDLDELSKRTLDAPVPGVTVRELLSISQTLYNNGSQLREYPRWVKISQMLRSTQQSGKTPCKSCTLAHL